MIKDNNRGYTLIELITVIVILTILGGFSFAFFEHAIKTYVLVKEQDALYSDGTYIMERIVRELNDAQTVTTPASTGVVEHTLVFNKLHPSAATITFALDGRTLKMNNFPIGKNIKTFDVKKNAAAGTAPDESITILLELNSLADTTIPTLSFNTTITPFNYSTGNYAERSFYGNYYENVKQ